MLDGRSEVNRGESKVVIPRYARDFGARLTPRKRLNFCNLQSDFCNFDSDHTPRFLRIAVTMWSALRSICSFDSASIMTRAKDSVPE